MNTLVIDANLVLALVLPLQYSDQAERFFDKWHAEPVEFAVPELWGYEVVSALRKAVVAGVISHEEGELAVRDIWALGVKEVGATVERHRKALTWSRQLGERVAYDAQYLVVAEQLEAPLWTADRRMRDQARAAGAEWVHWIGDFGNTASAP